MSEEISINSMSIASGPVKTRQVGTHITPKNAPCGIKIHLEEELMKPERLRICFRGTTDLGQMT
jgi:hypothetical protein